VYLRARYYASSLGIFTSKDRWIGHELVPQSFNKWQYTYENPINYFDSTGYITTDQRTDADGIRSDLMRYGVTIERDWGYWYDFSMMDPLGTFQCGWNEGRWNLIELKMVQYAVQHLNSLMDLNFNALIGTVNVVKTPDCAQGCTYARTIFRPAILQLSDKGKAPAENANMDDLIRNDKINFDVWTIVHEFGHAWDFNFGRRLSKALENYTQGYTDSRFGERYGNYPDYCVNDPLHALPGCNRAGYFYGGIPPAGSDANFTRLEDFAESVAASIFPDKAHELVLRFQNPNDPYYSLYYDDFRKMPRWDFIHGVIDGTIPY
jgi:hypothetical protein